VDSISVALRVVALQRWLSIGSMFSILVVPSISVVWLWRRTHGWKPWAIAGTWLSAFAVCIVYVTAAFVFGVCWGGEIGESGKNRLARAYGAPVFAALERYHEDSAAYPRQLSALVPRYLTADQLRAPEQSVLTYPFEYRADSGRFHLLVRYVGPGMNTCRIEPGQAWRCSGYF
jgi:hypothetical protein